MNIEREPVAVIQRDGVECVGGPWDGERRKWEGGTVQVPANGVQGGTVRAGVYVARASGGEVVYAWSGDQ